MPFKKVGTDDYTGPSGHHFDLNQVRLYYANGGKFPGQKGHPMNGYAKGGDVRQASYASGGSVLGRTRDFMKEPDAFRTDTGPGARQDYGGKGGNAAASKSSKDRNSTPGGAEFKGGGNVSSGRHSKSGAGGVTTGGSQLRGARPQFKAGDNVKAGDGSKRGRTTPPQAPREGLSSVTGCGSNACKPGANVHRGSYSK